MKKRLSNQPKLTTEQVKALASIAINVQRLQEEANPYALADKFGTSAQLIQYHINKLKEGDK